MTTLTTEQARRFYDRFGAKQDSQAFYEDLAVEKLVQGSDFGSASSVFELGCGTGRLAESLLRRHLPSSARYTAIDLSPVMIALAGERLREFSDRVALQLSDGSTRLDAPSGSFDRFVSTYVLDLLSPADVRVILAEAHRLLKPHALVCLTGITTGFTPVTRCVAGIWTAVHRIRPQLVGGCRPSHIGPALCQDLWRIRCHERVSAWGIPSEIVVAARLPDSV